VVRARLVNLLLAAVVGAVFVAGLFLHGVVAALLLLAVVAVLVLLTAAAWSAIPVHGAGRPGRVLVIAVVLLLAGAKLTGA
jgi:hypothetical protein